MNEAAELKEAIAGCFSVDAYVAKCQVAEFMSRGALKSAANSTELDGRLSIDW